MTKLLLVVACALLSCALRGAAAVTYGQPGVGSQYQLFGGQITDTNVNRISAIRAAPTVFAAAPDDAQQKAAPSANAQACDSGFVFSDVFGKCLPAPGKDGYIGKAYAEQVKGKGATESDSFAPISPISAQTYAPMVQPMRTAALSATGEQPQPPPAHARDHPPTSLRGRAIAGPVRPLRLACPVGFSFEPAMGACIAPAAALQQQAMRMRMNRPRNAEDDSDDSDDELHRERHPMFGRFHRHMFGRRFGFGGTRILAPVFVFVLPPLDRNATSRFGIGFGGRSQRIHEIHPSMVGPIGGATSASTPAASASATPRPETPKVVESEPKPGPKQTAPAGDTSAPTRTTGALRGAFVNPLIGSGKSLPLKSHSASSDAPLRPLRQRHAFISPLIETDGHVRVSSNSDAA